MQFRHEGVTLRLPGGISIDLMKYWDGQPVRFVCCERLKKTERTADRPWGRILWCVVIERADADTEADSLREEKLSQDGASVGQGSRENDVD